MAATAELSPDDFSFLCDLVHERSGIVLDVTKEYLIETRLRPVVKTCGLGTMSELVNKLREGRDRTITELVMEAMTTNETYFYRDNGFYDALEKSVLPRLIEECKERKTLTFWCAATSSGQEPYSVMMLISEKFPEILSWDFRFIVSDISKEMLERSREGVYSQHEVNRGLPAKLLVKYFRREGVNWQVIDELRDKIETREVNLIGPWPPLPKIDVIFMRNVLIYFDLEAKQRILSKARSVLRPEGMLFLGAAETTLNVDASWDRVNYPRAGCYKPKD